MTATLTIPKSLGDAFPTAGSKEPALATMEDTQNMRLLIVAMTARSGSTALCSILDKTQAYGKTTTEILNPRGPVPYLVNDYSLASVDEYIRYAIATLGSGTAFSFKTSWMDFKVFHDTGLHHKYFANAKWVFLDRIDLMAQAVSLFQAKQTGTWHQDKNTVTAQAGSATIDTAEGIKQIGRCLYELQRERFSWKNFFFLNNIQPLEVFYEEFIAYPSKTLDTISRFAGFELDRQYDLRDSRFEKIKRDNEELWLNYFYKHVYGFIPDFTITQTPSA